jgi:Phytanoyl-CoA dioxygenase (PhyH)
MSLINKKQEPAATVRLREDEIALFRSRGFLTLPQITTPAELEMLWPVFERLFAQRAGRAEGCHYDLVSHDDNDEMATLPNIVNPVNYAPELRHLQFRRNAAAIARQLLGPSATPAFENAILKPAYIGAATPWHQDEAYRVAPDFEYEQISVWMPLQDVTLENGCMQFIPETNLGIVLPHHSLNNDPRIHSNECIGGFDANDAVPCPMSAGGATVHGGRTLHFAGPNRTATPRCAYILAFELPPKPRRLARTFEWNNGKRTRNQISRSVWRRRGGIVIEAVRKYRLGMFRSPERILFEVRRGMQALRNYLNSNR